MPPSPNKGKRKADAEEDEKPVDEAALLSISGVGQAKLERYGEDFLAVIRAEGSTS